MAYGDFKDLPRRKAADQKHHVIKLLIPLKIQNMMETNANLLQWFINGLIKTLLVVVLKVKLHQIKN